jgi:transcriptional regulator with XRE-family HTH domain
MDTLKIGQYIQHLRKSAGMTQKELAERLNVSFQAVSKWETGECLPDTGLLPALCDCLDTTADRLLNGGSVIIRGRKRMRVEDVIAGSSRLEEIGRLFGERCTFYTAMIEGVNEKMNLDLLAYLRDPQTRDVLYAEVLIQGILQGCSVDMEEVEAAFVHRKMVETVRRYLSRTGGGMG